MAEPDDLWAEAGEYVLGTSPAAERAAFGARLATDARAAEAVAWWERALAPLADAVEPVRPSEAAWAGVLRRIDARAPANDGGVAPWWRAAAIAASALAAALAGWTALRPVPPGPVRTVTITAPAPPPRLAVASLGENAPKTGLLLTVDERTGTVIAQPVGVAAPSGRSLQLWWIVGTAAPRPVGLIDPARRARFALAPGTSVEGTTFAISVEPPGGSPTGAPTGPIPYTGTALRLPAT